MCPRVVPLRAPVSDLGHLYCSCIQSRAAWRYVRTLVHRHQPVLREEEDSVLVRFLFPRGNKDPEVVWLLATYMEMVQEQCVARGAKLLPLAVRGRLRERLRMSQSRAVQQLNVTV